MADSIPNLWSDDISINSLTPLAILRSQAGMLGRLTKGLVEAEVVTETATNDDQKVTIVQHHLDLIAPALGEARYRIVSARHREGMVYPVRVIAEVFNSPMRRMIHQGPWPEAASEDDFIGWLEEALRSSSVKLILHSLIARSNEAKGPLGFPVEPEKVVQSQPTQRKIKRRPDPHPG